MIGVSGYAFCGKDTFVKIAIDLLKKNGYMPIRLAFADMLKDEVEGMLKDNKFQATVKTDDSVAKALIRPLLVWWGCQRRYETEGGLYWIKEVDKQIQAVIDDLQSGSVFSSDKIVVLISDVRFPNEAKWVHEKWGGSVVHLKRFSNNWRKGGQDGSDEFLVKEYDKAPNEEEAKQDPIVESMADVKTEWESKKKASAQDASVIPDLQRVVFDALNQIHYFKHKEPIIGILSL